MPYQRNETVDRLLLQAYGQKAAVALPIPRADGAAVVGRFPAGVNNTLDHLVDAFVGWRERREVHWCFLIGGPGNGKSEALRILAGALNVTLPGRGTGDPAPRTVPSEWPTSALPVHDGLEIAFINDASIPRPECLGRNLPTSLYKDLVDGLERLDQAKPVVLFGNVNRGILIEEVAASESGLNAKDSSTRALAVQILAWLSRPDQQLDAASGLAVPFKPTRSTKYYSQAVFNGQTNKLVVHALFLDTLSLLEPSPGGAKSIDFSKSPPAVAPYHPIGSVDPSQGSREVTVAGERTAFWTKGSLWNDGGCTINGQQCAAYSVCPFAANAQWLRAPILREHFLSLMRGVEVAAGRRLSYRDLLAYLSLAIVGPPEEAWLNGLHPCRWVEDRHRLGDSQALAELAHRRVYVNLFPNPSSDSWKKISRGAKTARTVYGSVQRRFVDAIEPTLSPFHRSLARLDPARDADSWNELRTKILDICDAADIELPAVQLRNLPELPAASHSDGEQALDQLVSAEIAADLASGSRIGSDRVRILRKWRGVLLLRQAGLATGNFTFRNTINAWLREHSTALSELPGGSLLQVGLTNLILPRVELGAAQHHILVLPLRPRTYALSALPDPFSAFVAIPHGNLRVRMVAESDRLIAEISVVGATDVKRIADVVVDFAIAREGLIQATGDFTGFTEIGYAAFARIERARAALVGRKQTEDLLLHVVGSSGDHFRLEPNPTGTPALRAM
jgi:hypothetical protein